MLLERIAELEDGAIVKDGTHQELIHTGGTYESLWDQLTTNWFVYGEASKYDGEPALTRYTQVIVTVNKEAEPVEEPAWQ